MKSAAILGLYAAAIGEEKEMKMNSVDDIGTPFRPFSLLLLLP